MDSAFLSIVILILVAAFLRWCFNVIRNIISLLAKFILFIDRCFSR